MLDDSSFARNEHTKTSPVGATEPSTGTCPYVNAECTIISFRRNALSMVVIVFTFTKQLYFFIIRIGNR